MYAQFKMQNQINKLKLGSTYRFRIGDNNTTHIGQYEGVDGDNLKFYVTEYNEGSYKMYPISMISAWQPRQGVPGIDEAFVMLPNGGNRKSRNSRNSRNSRKCRKSCKCRKCRKSRKYSTKRH
jgi:hypothetical protein